MIPHLLIEFASLCVLAGALHVLAPDHWVPASILGWQKGWWGRKIALFSTLAFVGHLLLGFLVYRAFTFVLGGLPPALLMYCAFVLVIGLAAFRSLRLGKMGKMMRGQQRGTWCFFTALSMLGPAESLIPILLKARDLGFGYWVPFGAFYFGTWIVGAALILSGRILLSRPALLPSGLHWAQRQVTFVPVLASLALGFSYLLKI